MRQNFDSTSTIRVLTTTAFSRRKQACIQCALRPDVRACTVDFPTLSMRTLCNISKCAAMPPASRCPLYGRGLSMLLPTKTYIHTKMGCANRAQVDESATVFDNDKKSRGIKKANLWAAPRSRCISSTDSWERFLLACKFGSHA